MNTPDSLRYQQVAEVLWTSRHTRVAVAPLREFLASDDLGGAYEVQRINCRRRLASGAMRIGRKIGLTSAAVQKQLGVDQPDYGLLFADMRFDGPLARIRVGELMQPKIEGEIAFIVAEDIIEAGLPRTELLRRAGTCTAAFEIVDSAIADWKITLADTVADNASCGALVMGGDRVPVASRDLRLAAMVLSADGEVVSRGAGAASLGDPVLAFEWLVQRAVGQGDPIRAGEVVLTGALGPMVPLVKGRRYRLEIDGFSPIEVAAE